MPSNDTKERSETAHGATAPDGFLRQADGSLRCQRCGRVVGGRGATPPRTLLRHLAEHRASRFCRIHALLDRAAAMALVPVPGGWLGGPHTHRAVSRQALVLHEDGSLFPVNGPYKGNDGPERRTSPTLVVVPEAEAVDLAETEEAFLTETDRTQLRRAIEIAQRARTGVPWWVAESPLEDPTADVPYKPRVWDLT